MPEKREREKILTHAAASAIKPYVGHHLNFAGDLVFLELCCLCLRVCSGGSVIYKDFQCWRFMLLHLAG